MPPPTIDESMIAALGQLGSPRVCELVLVRWPAPSGDVYYASSQYDDLPGYEALKARGLNIQARLTGDRFQDVTFSSGLGDETVDLDPADVDGSVSALYALHGPGLRVEVFYYFPEVDWLTSVWWGHLKPPEGATREVFKVKASSGFRSAQLPLPRRAPGYRGCQALFGGKLDSLAEIARNDCPYNRHLGGDVGNLDPLTGLPYTDCPRTDKGVCIARLEPPGATRAPQFLASDTVVETVINRQTKGSTLYPSARGNESNLKRPYRVFFGYRRVRDCDLLAYIPQYNNNHPDKGFVRCLFAVGEGPNAAMWECAVNDVITPFEHLNVRLGLLRQPPTAFSPNVSNYSGTALFLSVYGQVNPANFGPENLSGSCMLWGLNNIRVYSDTETYIEALTVTRGWCLMEVMTNRRWGHGLDVARFFIEDWIALAEWCDEVVTHRDPQGNAYTGPRSTFHAELTDRSAQQQISDICLAGHFGLPFQHGGRMRVLPLKKEEDLAACPVFTDEGEGRNIVRSGREQRSSLSYSQKSDAEVANRWVVTFDDASENWREHTLTFEDVDAQLRAGKAFGDHTVRVVEKKQSLSGVTNYGEAVRMGWLLLDLGPHDEGGLRNNFSVKFTTWFQTAIDLHRYKVIRVVSTTIEKFGFEYFRIQSIRRRGNLHVEITAQAYPVDYYEAMEDAEEPPPPGPVAGIVNPGGRRGGRPEPIGVDELDFGNDRVYGRIAWGEFAV
jgi:hypothetical protein